MALFVAGSSAVVSKGLALTVANGAAPQAFAFGFQTGAVILFRAHVVNTDSIDHNVFIGLFNGADFHPIGFAFLGAATPANPTFQNIIAGLAAPQNSGIPVDLTTEVPGIQVAEGVLTDGAVMGLVAVAI